MAYLRPRYYDGRSHYGWSPSSSQQESYESGEARKPRHHQKSHVAFKESVEEVVTRDYDQNDGGDAAAVQRVRPYSSSQPGRFGSAYESVDQEADAFIKTQHRRIEIAKLKSLAAADPTITYITKWTSLKAPLSNSGVVMATGEQLFDDTLLLLFAILPCVFL
ncbi:uncharacterized protein G2W53_008376 [Senna tora]|uniref:Uncharacterized protein n=1 Tax=Senna tora TaxID=362788 RepID=A0A835CF59_9FABA|nr:uncharacterized protein G2W53_008376 [Senna tora]